MRTWYVPGPSLCLSHISYSPSQALQYYFYSTDEQTALQSLSNLGTAQLTSVRTNIQTRQLEFHICHWSLNMPY